MNDESNLDFLFEQTSNFHIKIPDFNHSSKFKQVWVRPIKHTKSKKLQILYKNLNKSEPRIGLPGTAQMKLLTDDFEAEPLLAHWIQAVVPLMDNLTQTMAPLLANRTCVIPCKNPKHKENDRSSQKKTRSGKILLN